MGKLVDEFRDDDRDPQVDDVLQVEEEQKFPLQDVETVYYKVDGSGDQTGYEDRNPFVEKQLKNPQCSLKELVRIKQRDEEKVDTRKMFHSLCRIHVFLDEKLFFRRAERCSQKKTHPGSTIENKASIFKRIKMAFGFEFLKGCIQAFGPVKNLKEEIFINGQTKELISNGIFEDYADFSLAFIILRDFEIGSKFGKQIPCPFLASYCQ
jgi:hypothetical protein